jgi:ribosomal protein S18 acetylase RimI-like enzyme
VGFVTLETSREGRAVVLAIAVDPEAQGQGVGERLMRAAERHARQCGARVLGLCTAEANLAALDLFHKRGLGIVRRLPRYYSRGQNACWLEKSIA